MSKPIIPMLRWVAIALLSFQVLPEGSLKVYPIVPPWRYAGPPPVGRVDPVDLTDGQ